MEKPDYLTNEHLVYFDNLLDEAKMSSFTASQLFMHRFPTLSLDQVNTILTYWLYSYSERKHF
ncbi:hypothetical protein [Desulfogranum japonicum]|uniref:hypothetical protein n=1 Tax=Desulfogranum japonicum TaxID=231447 RepID=UPI000424D8F5|nr:hypothetical protein [Desulfogranum japonicum]